MVTTSHQETGSARVPPSPCLKRRTAMMSPEQLEKARERDRLKYARRMARDHIEFLAKRREIQNRYYRKQRGVQVELVSTPFSAPGFSSSPSGSTLTMLPEHKL